MTAHPARWAILTPETPMTGLFEAAFAKYSWVWIGITFGFAAKYALLIKRGVRIRPQLVAADILLLPMVALIAYAVVSRVGVSGEMGALLSALCTVGADRLIKLATDRFFKEVESEIDEVANRIRGKVREEVQVEKSGANIIKDTLTGTAPDQYEALKPHPRKPK